MTIWEAGKVKVVHLDHYNIIDWLLGSHFIGNNMLEHGARVSTKIKVYNPKTRVGTTASGTEYRLYGEPGLDDDGEYLLGRATKGLEYELRW